jgi:hypothetical protein
MKLFVAGAVAVVLLAVLSMAGYIAVFQGAFTQVGAIVVGSACLLAGLSAE